MREKIFKSLNTSDLSNEEWENAAHVVASIGAAQINRRQLTLGALLLRLRAGHAQFLPRILALLSLTIASRARRSHWKGIGRHNAHTVAQIAVDRFLDVLCSDCRGVGTIGELGQVIVLCQTCRGSGKRKDSQHSMADDLNMSIAQFKEHGIAAHLKEILALMDRMEGMAAGGTKLQARGN